MKTFKVPLTEMSNISSYVSFLFFLFFFTVVVNCLTTLTSNIFFIQIRKYTLIENENVSLICIKILSY